MGNFHSLFLAMATWWMFQPTFIIDESGTLVWKFFHPVKFPPNGQS